MAPSSNLIWVIRAWYSSGGTSFPVGCTSISRRMIPDLASEIRTLWFDPMNRNAFARPGYGDLNFSLISIISCEITWLSLVLSLMCDRSPSCWMATRLLVRNISEENRLDWSVNSLASNTVQYPSNSQERILRNVDFPVPAAPYSTMNFWMSFESPAMTEPTAHSSFSRSSGSYSVPISLLYALTGPGAIE